MVKKDNIDEVKKPTPVMEDKGSFTSAIEFGLTSEYGIGVANAVRTLDPAYRANLYESDWKRIFAAFMSKPENVSWKDYFKN